MDPDPLLGKPFVYLLFIWTYKVSSRQRQTSWRERPYSNQDALDAIKEALTSGPHRKGSESDDPVEPIRDGPLMSVLRNIYSWKCSIKQQCNNTAMAPAASISQ